MLLAKYLVHKNIGIYSCLVDATKMVLESAKYMPGKYLCRFVFSVTHIGYIKSLEFENGKVDRKILLDHFIVD